jgi:hypothetical protein
MSPQVLDYVLVDSSDSSLQAEAVSTSGTVSNLMQAEDHFSDVPPPTLSSETVSKLIPPDDELSDVLIPSTFSLEDQFLDVSIPPTLTLLSNRGKHRCVLYTDSLRSQFLEWWKTTSAAKQQKTHKWGSPSRKSEVWDQFHEVALFPRGEPKVRCQHCQKLLEHPYRGNQGTNAMSRHLKSSQCSYSQKPNQKSIKHMVVRKQVCPSINSNLS